MNLKIAKQRGSRGDPTISSENPIQLTSLYSKPGALLQCRDYSEKQNVHPNIRNNQKPKLKELTPKKKVIHLRSVHRNSRSNKAGNSGSRERRFSNEHYCTEVTDFNDKFVDNPRPIKIEIDLKSHRRSMQDTLVSSNAQELNNLQQIINCVEHDQKRATFIIRGKPYCDKCSVKFITKGFVAMKIKNTAAYQSIESGMLEPEPAEREKERRNKNLRLFIDDLDKLEPVLESIDHQLECSLGNLKSYFQNQCQQFEQSWSSFVVMLQQQKQNAVSKMRAEQDRAIAAISQIKSTITKEANNLAFMRNDIIRNIDRITDQAVISSLKYASVMQSFTAQMQQMQQNIISTLQTSVPVQITQLQLEKLGRDINNYILMGFSTWALFEPGQTSKPLKMQNQNPYRLSFGRDAPKLTSPTFKQI